MELWDVYDKNRNKTGKTVVRGEPFPDDAFHLVVHVCAFNTLGEMLIQQRQPFKDGWPDMWDVTVGGSVVAGESSQQAAARELFEEIGLAMDFTETRPHLSVSFTFGFDDFYLMETEIEVDKLALQYEEVQRVKWASKEDIFSLIDRGEFIPYHKNLLGLLFDMRMRYSTQSK